MREKLESLKFIFPIMLYFMFEAIIVGVFITILWVFFLANKFGHLNYFQIVVIYWIIKMLLFDVFKLINSFNTGNEIINKLKDEEQ
ncbi:MAG: hypothetical protein PF487_12180 [Bacteroidales bacterium]|jgi:hypothetical protein|nr:hypothetical protein [Bacteroidales bacterium]